MSFPKEFTGRYFDGISTRAQVVSVALNKNLLKITQIGVWDQHKSWEINKLISIDREKSKLILRYGSAEQLEILEVSGEEFIQQFKNNSPSTIKIKSPTSPLKYILSSLLFLLISIVVLVYVFLIPWLITKTTAVFPKETEINMGKVMLKSFLANEKINLKGTTLINKFYQRSGIQSDYPIHLTLVESPQVNAFALPGGEIVVYTGILKKMTSYEELVALTGHETGHIQLRHTLKLLVKQFSVNMIIGALFQNYGDLTALLVERAAELHNLSYNRAAEEEADQFGFKAMLASEIDPTGMIRLFKHLKEDEKGTAPPEFLITHPTTNHRVKIISKQLKLNQKKYNSHSELQTIWNSIVTIQYPKDTSSSF